MNRLWLALKTFWRILIDPEFAALSPGTLVIGTAIESAIREGCGEFDFLRGDEEYKYFWGAAVRPNVLRKLFHTGGPGS